jgi:hypothetical protein
VGRYLGLLSALDDLLDHDEGCVLLGFLQRYDGARETPREYERLQQSPLLLPLLCPFCLLRT